MIKNKYKNLIFNIMELIALIAFFVIFIFNDNMNSHLLCLLPLCNFIFMGLYSYSSCNRDIKIGSLIIIGSYFVRLTSTPLLMQLGSYFRRTSINLNYDKAIIYMIYEYVIVMIIMLILNEKFKKRKIIYEYYSSNKMKVNLPVNVIIIFLTAISIIFVYKYPGILSYFRIGFLNENETNQWYINFYKAKKEVPTIPYYLITWTLTLLRYIYVYMIIISLKNSNVRGKMFYSLIVIFASLMITTSTLSDSLYFAIIYIMLLMELYKEKYDTLIKTLAVCLIIVVGIGLFYMSVIRHNDDNIFYTMSRTCMAYFSGIDNIANALEIDNYNTFELIKGDFLRSLPLIKGFFVNLTRTDTIFNQYIGDVYESQITPTLGQSYIYFGTILSPLLSCIFTIMTIVFENELDKEKRFDKRFLMYLLIIRCACVPVMYNAHIFLIGIFNSWVPLIALFALNNKRREDGGKNESINIL